jgi:hypothetical protein
MVPPSIIAFLAQLPNATTYDGMSHSLSYIQIAHYLQDPFSRRTNFSA